MNLKLNIPEYGVTQFNRALKDINRRSILTMFELKVKYQKLRKLLLRVNFI